jgi:hypothetical protein
VVALLDRDRLVRRVSLPLVPKRCRDRAKSRRTAREE